MDVKKKVRKLQLLEANKEEGKVIRHLEKALKLKKRKRKKSVSHEDEESKRSVHHMFIADGLDYILDVTDHRETSFQLDNQDNKNSSKRMDREKNYPESPIVRSSAKKFKKFNVLSDECLDQEDVNETNPHGDLCDDILCSDQSEKVVGIDHEYKEDIYGRLRDKSGNIVNKSDVCSQLSKLSEVSIRKEKQNDLLRQLKGLTNRLSESNMSFVSSQIENMFMRNSRNGMIEALYSVISELIIGDSLKPARLIMEHAVLIAILHANIGPDIGVFFLQKLASQFQDLVKCDETYGKGKQCDNLLLFLSQLYNCKVCDCVLVTDIIQNLVDSFQAKDIELILLLLKCAGFQLRKQNPLKFKEITNLIKMKAESLKQNSCGNDSRIRFILDMVTSVRNNNKYKVCSHDGTVIGDVNKIIKCHVRPGKSVQEMSVSLSHLLSAENKSRWSVVPAPCAEKKPDGEMCQALIKETVQDPPEKYSSKVIGLAKKLHMNTEIRKKIFFIIMMAEDCMDAFEKLLALKNQHDEVISVIIYCMLHEKTFNPFYAFLSGKLCHFSRKYKLSLQYLLWDQFKAPDKLKPNQMKSLACFVAHLVLMQDLPISVLKVIHFSEMNKDLAKFVRQILMKILLHESEEECLNVFIQISSAKNLTLFREGLRLFMHHFLLNDCSSVGADMREKLRERVKLCEKTLKIV